MPKFITKTILLIIFNLFLISIYNMPCFGYDLYISDLYADQDKVFLDSEESTINLNVHFSVLNNTSGGCLYCSYNVAFFISETASETSSQDLSNAWRVSLLSISGIPVGSVNDYYESIAAIIPNLPTGEYFLGTYIDWNYQIFDENRDNNITWSSKKLIIVNNNQSYEPYCYPNPARLSSGDLINFKYINSHAEIKIFLPSGQIIKSFRANESGYIPPWDGKTDSGQTVASGTYIVHVNDNKNKRKLFKLIIIK